MWFVLLFAACGSDGEPSPPAADASIDAALDASVDAEVALDASVPSTEPRVDGLFDDWEGVPLLASDPAGDGGGAFDVTELRARSQGTLLFLLIDLGAGAVLNLNAGDRGDGTLILDVAYGDHDLSIDFRELDPRLDGGALLWEDLDFESAPTHSASRFEMSMDLGLVGASPGDEIAIGLDGSDSLEAPATFVLDGEAPELVHRDTARADGTDVRIASNNVLKSGLLPGSRRDDIERLLSAADADVYCLQEEYDLTLEELAVVFQEISGEDGWNVHKVRDNVIATRFPLTPIDGRHERYALALVEVPDAGPLVVVAGHLDCCGWDGNADDALRIDEAHGIVESLEDFRATADPTAAAAPIIVIGDWNLVGSREPLDIVLDEGGLGLVQWLVPQLVGEHVTTWRSSSSYFPPGILDLVVHDAALVEKNGFVLEERRLSSGERTALGLEDEDGLATDHIPVVVDFDLP